MNPLNKKEKKKPPSTPNTFLLPRAKFNTIPFYDEIQVFDQSQPKKKNMRIKLNFV